MKARVPETAMKILYIEDTEEFIQSVGRMAKILGHTLIAAMTGEQGYALLGEQPNLILVDMNLPDTDGLTLTRRIRAANITVPIVAITGDLVKYSRKVALEAGCNDFVEKPFTLDAIKNVILSYEP
jgi:CheY-like chemotaxis protein